MRRFAMTVLAAAGLAACITFAGTVDNPIERSLTWFSFVAGDDIRAACSEGSQDRYRFLYNGVYERQIRAYELVMTEEGALLTARARNRAGNVARFQFRNPLGPWELRRSHATLPANTVSALVEALERDVAAALPAAGQRLRSNSFYWTVAVCRSGAFTLHAFEQDRVALGELAFRAMLLDEDGTDVAFAEAKRIEGFSENAFEIRINGSGDGIVSRL